MYLASNHLPQLHALDTLLNVLEQVRFQTNRATQRVVNAATFAYRVATAPEAKAVYKFAGAAVYFSIVFLVWATGAVYTLLRSFEPPAALYRMLPTVTATATPAPAIVAVQPTLQLTAALEPTIAPAAPIAPLGVLITPYKHQFLLAPAAEVVQPSVEPVQAPAPVTLISGRALAKVFGVSVGTLAKNWKLMTPQRFAEWSASKDPHGRHWQKAEAGWHVA